MPRTTVSATVERIRRQLDSSLRLEINTVAVNLAANAGDTTITLTYALSAGLRAGAVLSVNKELMRVLSVDTVTKECVVLRAWQDSSLDAHGVGDEVLINPRFTYWDIVDGIHNEIASWGDRLYQVVSYQWTVTDEDTVIEVPTALSTATGVVSLRRKWTEDTDSDAWPELDYKLYRGNPAVWDLATESGLMIRMLPNHGVRRGGTVFAELAIPYDVTTELELDDDLVDDVGLTAGMIELVELGVRMRLMTDQENARTARQAQDEPRRTEETPPGSAIQVGQTLRQLYERRFADEMAKLQRKHPVRAW